MRAFFKFVSTGCDQIGVVLVFDKRTGMFVEVSSPWATLRLGRLKGWS